MKILVPSFYRQPANVVAERLLGQKLHLGDQWGWITETEAYLGNEDPASHAFNGPTLRNKPMYMEGGHIYVYLIYGMHHCFNVVTDIEGVPSAVLIRGIYVDQSAYHANGPGKLTKKLGIDRSFNGQLLGAKSNLWVSQGLHNLPFQQNSRIGIKQGLEHPWRYTLTKIPTKDNNKV
ncbi:MAG TPA: DNA-3-methyladenine glycosylase [Gammaproteobacteria bacterium]|nr:DNA-3-methyladenine glycosylase [Gammaproteobacteria bacterium]